MSDRELVLTTLNNLPKQWDPFLLSISGREILPTFDRLWIDCTQEELRLRNRGVKESLEENHAIALPTKKGGKFKRNFRQTFKYEKSSSNPGYQRRYVSEFQCFRCDKYGHYARNCPTFDRLWTNCTQEELRLRNRGVEDSSEENHSLALHTNKGGKFKRNFRQTFKDEKSSSNLDYQRRDVSEIQCFRCEKYGHYARNCPTRKKGRKYASTTDIDPEPPQKNEDKREEKYF
jgi:hypothetical protein